MPMVSHVLQRSRLARRQRHSQADRRIIEVALFFLREIRGRGPSSPQRDPLAVVLLSNDLAQTTLARSHGLPACSTRDLDELGSLFDAAAKQGPVAAGASAAPDVCLTASVVRRCIATVACTGT